MIKTLVLQEAVSEKKEGLGSLGSATKVIRNISSECAVRVTIEIAADYSDDNIKEALVKIFERAAECF